MFKSVGIVARYDKEKALSLADELANYLSKRDVEIFFEDTLKDKVKFKGRFIPLIEMRTDFIVTIGGDGTILRTCITIPKPEPPIFAINMGVRGFMTEVEPEEARASLDRILENKFRIEKCTKLSSTNKNHHYPDALNDVVVSGGEPSKILYLQIYKDDKPILQCEADGLIISTRTGSTGYSMSAGGPILDPDVGAIIITPICSLTTFPPIIFPAESRLSIEALRRKEIQIFIDGNSRHHLSPENSKITITKSKNTTSFIRFEDKFYSRVKQRLLFRGMG